MTEPSERLSAHQRLATGAFARWTRACATHPWRVVLGWIGIIALLIVLVGTIGGSLKDEFEIPGSDTQKATDLIETEFASEQGGVLNLVFAAPEGERLDTTERREAIEDAVAQLETDEFAPSEDEAGIESVGDPFSEETVLRRRADRVRGGPVRPGHLRQGPRGRSGRPGRRPRGGRAGRRHGRVQRRRRVPADRAGNAGAARPARGADRAARRLPHVRRDVHPDRAGARRPGDGVPAPVHPRRPDRHQHDHAAARVDDRPRRRHRLLAVHRHALQTGAARRAVAGRRGRRGRRVRGPSRALRRPDGRDLGHRARLLRARLRDEARDRLGARRPDDGADRELAPDRGAPAARAQGRPAEGAVPAADRRLRGGPREDPGRPLGTVRDRGTRRSSSSSSCSGSWPSPRPRRSSAWARPTRGRSRRSRRPVAPTTCWPRASAPASTARSRSSST